MIFYTADFQRKVKHKKDKNRLYYNNSETLFLTITDFIYFSDGCENKKCDFYSECESDGTSEGRCVCPLACTDPKVSDFFQNQTFK